MRRIVADLDRVTAEMVERPKPGTGDALVRMSVTGVCGSDTHAVHGRHPLIPSRTTPDTRWSASSNPSG